MSLSELTGRVRQGTSRWLDRTASRSRLAPLTGLRPAGAPRVEELRAASEAFHGAAGARFFAGAGDRALLSRLGERFPQHVAEVIGSAQALATGHIGLLGYSPLRLGEPIDWQRDAVSGIQAPARHWTRLDPLAFDSVGDSKVTWELNRHQWIVTLAQAYALTGEPQYARTIVATLHDWNRANPYAMGINWTSSLEVAYRLIAWCWVLVLVRDAGVLPPAALSDVLSLVWTHARHVERYLSHYFSPNTHLTGEALGLFYAGVLFPELGAARRWRDEGARILIDEARRQIFDDGVYFEQSTCYQRYTIEIYLHFLILAARNGVAVPADVTTRVDRMLEVLLFLNHRDGTMPPIGDADGGWLLPLQHRGPGDSRGVFGSAAALTGRADFAWAAGGAVPEVAWLLGGEGVSRWARITPAPPSVPASRVFAEGGYAVMRSGWEPDAHRLIVDVGPLGCRVSGAHGHADLLSVQCAAFGEDYLVDPGTYGYTSSPAWRDHFRSAAAHNTLTIDGASQARPVGPFGWEGRPVATLRAWRSDEGYDFVDAAHGAYSRVSEPITHRRRVLFVKPHYWAIVDDVSGSDRHEWTLHFQFAPRRVTLEPGGWTRAEGRDGTGLWLAPFAPDRIRGTMHAGELDPIRGWVSPHYGQRHPAPLVVYASTARLPTRIVTLLLPTRELVAPPQVDALRGDHGGLEGLRLPNADETIRIDDEAITITRGGRTERFACAGS
jgi:Heparinase II/III-like protein/Heparinase II/III N-terminus